ncbi:MAG: PIN domain-containing protein [Archangium sp.]
MKYCFVDTWAWLALLNRKDRGHAVAAEASEWLETHGWVLCTSDWILDETATELHAIAGASVALRFLDDVEALAKDRRLLVAGVSSERMNTTVQNFRKLAPKVPRLSLTDCCSFALMSELEIRWAFTADRHFLRAGPKIAPLIIRDGEELHFRPPE